MANYDDIKTSTVALIGAIGTILVVAIILLLAVLYYRQEQAIDVRDRDRPNAEWSTVRAEQQARLQTVAIGSDAKPVGESISEAMRGVVRDLSAPPAAPASGGNSHGN